jgi:hypothetical protein
MKSLGLVGLNFNPTTTTNLNADSYFAVKAAISPVHTRIACAVQQTVSL